MLAGGGVRLLPLHEDELAAGWWFVPAPSPTHRSTPPTCPCPTHPPTHRRFSRCASAWAPAPPRKHCSRPTSPARTPSAWGGAPWPRRAASPSCTCEASKRVAACRRRWWTTSPPATPPPHPPPRREGGVSTCAGSEPASTPTHPSHPTPLTLLPVSPPPPPPQHTRTCPPPLGTHRASPHPPPCCSLPPHSSPPLAPRARLLPLGYLPLQSWQKPVTKCFQVLL